MILISNNPVDINTISNGYPTNSTEKAVIDILSASEEKYEYDSLDQLKFELNLRKEIVNAAKELNNSGMSFAVFRKSTCNPAFWDRTDEGGFVLKEGVKPSDAIRDIYKNGYQYATECATAMIIVYYKALLAVLPEETFNNTFTKIHLMNWHYIDNRLKEVGLMKKAKDYLPGDRRYFANPDVDPITPEWQGENTIDLGGGRYYGHGIGIHNADTIISALNQNRKEGAEKSAYLMDSAGRPNFKSLAKL